MHAFLTSALVGDESSASRPGLFTSGVAPPGSHWKEGWEAPEPVWTQWRIQQIPSLPGMEPRSFNP
jgi:hypothetical protein